MTLFADILLIIIIFAGFLYAINKDYKNKGNHKDNKDEDEVDEVEDEVKDEDEVENEDENEDDKDEDNKDAEDEQFKSEWYAIIKERIEYENKLSKENLNKIHDYHKINWRIISLSSNPIAIKLLQEYPENINWDNLCANEHPYAIELIKKYTGKINWSSICMNKNLDVISLIKERIELEKSLITRDNYNNYPNRINWDNLIKNKNAHELIMDKIEYDKYNIDYKANNVKAKYSMQIYEKIVEKDKKSLIIFNKVRDLDNFDWSILTERVITQL